jgi:CYTH domain-containing protein
MPIEHERKLILHTPQHAQLMQQLRGDASVEWFDITQAYMSNSCRIRHVVPHRTNYHTEQFVFTFKTKVRGATVEIESPIDVHDYQKLFLISKPVIVKTRAKITCVDHHWDVDFLRKPKSGEVYLVMAEVEMPEFTTELPDVHKLLEPYALKWIDQGDKRFNNRNLSNPKKAARAVAEIVDAKAATK